MRLQDHPELLQRLAASHALGTLRGPARRRFETIAREQPAVRAAALTWQGQLAGLNELQPGEQPAPAVWTRIDNLLRAEREQAALRQARDTASASSAQAGEGWRTWLRSLALWRGATALAALGALAAVTLGLGLRNELGTEVARLQTQLQQQAQAQAQPEYVAVLADAQAGAAMLVSFDANSSQLTLQRLGAYREAQDRSLELWALPATGSPRSLGVLERGQVLRLRAPASAVRGVPALAITLEPLGGVPPGSGPTGPVLFKGDWIRKQL